MSDSSSPPLITPEMVALDADLGSTKADVIASLAGLVAATGRAEAAGLTADAMAREGKSATGLPGGFAIPHCRSAAVNTGSLGFARLSNPVDFGAKDGPADLVFLIAAAEGGGADHMKLLTKLARALVKKDFLAALRSAASAEEIVKLVTDVVEPPAAAAATPAAPAPAQAGAGGGKVRRIVAITACPTGIAHTYMAADSLTQAGQEEGIDVQVETQGSSATTPFSPETIAAAEAVIFATDVGVKGRERFAGKPVIESGVKRAINEPKVMLAEAIAAADDPNSRKVGGDASAAAASSSGAGSGGLGWGSRLKQVLLTGVSYMVPFVAAGGLLIALGFLVGGWNITEVSADVVINNSLANLPEGIGDRGPLLIYFGSLLHQLGAAAFGFLVPALAGYIAFGMADRPGIVPGFTAGAVAVLVGAGFIGGLIGGLLAGMAAYWIASWRVPRFLAGLMPVVIIPLLATLFAAGLIVLFGQPLAAITTGLTNWLNGMSGSGAVLLGIILGLMMCFDLGGPVNKAAYAFASAGLDPSNPASLKIMAAVMVAGMVPPLALALATTLRPKLFTTAERENGRAGWLLGLSFISEGAIPFAAADPLRVIPSMMLGGAAAGAISMATGATVMAPHGGVFVVFAMGNILGFFLALIAGMVVGCLAVVVLKSMAAGAKAEPEAAVTA